MCNLSWRFGAAALACVAMASPASAYVVGDNLLGNGDFETVDGRVGLVNGNTLDALSGSGKTSWDVYETLPGGWQTAGGFGIEVQSTGTITNFEPHSADHYVELDSEPKNGQSNSRMEQQLTLDAGAYEFSFYYSPRTQDVGTNGIAYFIETNILDGEVTGPDATQNTDVGSWTLIRHVFEIAADGTEVTVGFAATGEQDTLGGFVDTVRISQIPLPAAGWFLLAAAGGLLAAGRARRAA